MQEPWYWKWSTCKQRDNSKQLWHPCSKTWTLWEKDVELCFQTWKWRYEKTLDWTAFYDLISVCWKLLESQLNDACWWDVPFVSTESDAWDVIDPWQLVCKCKAGIKLFLRSFIYPISHYVCFWTSSSVFQIRFFFFFFFFSELFLLLLS